MGPHPKVATILKEEGAAVNEKIGGFFACGESWPDAAILGSRCRAAAYTPGVAAARTCGAIPGILSSCASATICSRSHKLVGYPSGAEPLVGRKAVATRVGSRTNLQTEGVNLGSLGRLRPASWPEFKEVSRGFCAPKPAPAAVARHSLQALIASRAAVQSRIVRYASTRAVHCARPRRSTETGHPEPRQPA